MPRGGWRVQVDGEWVVMPFGGNWMVPTLEGRFPNEVLLRMDEDRFKTGFEGHAIRAIHGNGEYAILSYCGEGLTIERHATLEEAITAKRAIDVGGCGGGCVKVHIIVHVDPKNSRQARQDENIRKWRAEHPD